MKKIYFAVNNDGTEICCNYQLFRHKYNWSVVSESEYNSYYFIRDDDPNDYICVLPKGSIYKLTGKNITWEDNYIEVIVF